MKKIITQIGQDRILRIRWEVPADANNRGGLAIFGEKLGCYPVPPTIIIKLNN